MLDSLFFSMPVLAKRLIVGLAHGPKTSTQKRLDERSRVLRHLSNLLPGSKVGIELSREQLVWIKTNPAVEPRDTLEFAARAALAKGLEVVPLDSERRMEKHREIIGLLRERMAELPSQWRSGKVTPKIIGDYKKARRNFVLHKYTRSIGMGLAIQQNNLQLNFVGDAHAHHLNTAMADAHQFEFSKEPILGSETEVFSHPENAGLKEKLEALLMKRLALKK